MSPESPRKYRKWAAEEISLLTKIRNEDPKSSWEEVMEEFNNGVGSERERNVSSLKNKWREIAKVGQLHGSINVYSHADRESHQIIQSVRGSPCPPAEARRLPNRWPRQKGQQPTRRLNLTSSHLDWRVPSTGKKFHGHHSWSMGDSGTGVVLCKEIQAS